MQSYKSLLMGLVLIVTSIPFVLASAPAETISANVPFDFKIGKEMYESGKYMLQLSAERPPVIIEMKTGHKRFLIGGVRREANRNKRPQLIFNRYGSQNFLREILGANKGYSLKETDEEKAVREASGTAPVKVIIGN